MKNISGFKIKRSRNGKGVFVTKTFKVGDKLFEIKGKVITYSKNLNLKREFTDDYFRLGENNFIDPKEQLAFFVNHSCLPNTKIEKIRGMLYMTAISNLENGEEVCIDYTTNSAIDDTWSMRCNCGERNCRKNIKNIADLPKDIFTKYVRLRIIPKYILKIK